MAINLFEARYIPTIFLRNSELSAVRELPDSTKDQLTPIFCLKPWATTKYLAKAVDKIESVFGDGRKYFLDIDPFYSVETSKRPAHDEFLDLIDNDDSAQNWVDFLADHPNASPCIQIKKQAIADIILQIDAFTEMERPFLVRLGHGGGAGANWHEVVNAVCSTDHVNFGIVIDLEWSPDLLSRIEWADRIVKQIVEVRGDSIPICINGSSFPNSFTKFASGDGVPALERLAFNNLTSNNNQARLIYGDWASSRPPGESLPIKTEIPPRIDLPTPAGWEFYRIRSDDGGFKEAASQALASSSFPQGVDIWGTYLISSTAASTGDENEDQSAIISHRGKAAAARINIHLYRQQFYENFDPAPDTDDDYPE